MDRTLLSKIWPVFVEEAREHLQQISAGILELERPGSGRPPGLLDSVRRTAHSVKGSASSLGLHDIEKIAHAVEGALSGLGPSDQLDAARVEAILAAIDAAEAALSRGDAGGEPSIPDIDAQLQRLVNAKSATSAPAAAREPTAQEQMWPVFRAEAKEHLERLQQALAAHPGGEKWAKEEAAALEKVAATLRASASILGLWEMERVAGQAEATLGEAFADGKMPKPRLERLRRAVEALTQAVGAEVGTAPAPSAPSLAEPPAPFRPAGALVEVFQKESAESVAALEAAVLELVSPFVTERAKRVEEATRRAHNLKGSAGAVGAGDIS